VDDVPVTKSGAQVPLDSAVRVRAPDHPYVSRGGLKLEAALESFELSVEGRVALDVGASTGGFTDCLLQRGATRVHTIDVGHGQLAWQLRQDPRVLVRERVNARFALPVDEPVGLATIDVSFISLVVVLPSVVDTVVAGGRIIGLVKPQFEARRGDVGRGGIVRDPRIRAGAVGKVCLAGLELGLRVRGVAGSVLAGPKGNREVFVLFEK
jgi:23S rRNA (cytidine1920-2'-O)/16S rRNA (cytidine1409-2'-O)-methyltransferase